MAIEFTAIVCTCGLTFAVPSGHERRLRDTHEGFCCPRGCRLAFSGETPGQRATRLLARAERRADEEQRRATAEREAAERLVRRLRAARGRETKLKRRLAAQAAANSQPPRSDP